MSKLGSSSPPALSFPAAPEAPRDRRRRRRHAAAQPGKVLRSSDASFAPAMTANISLSGALLEVRSHRPFRLGESLGVAIGGERGRAVVARGELRPARVVRIEPVGADSSRHLVAVEFLRA